MLRGTRLFPFKKSFRRRLHAKGAKGVGARITRRGRGAESAEGLHHVVRQRAQREHTA